MKSTSWTLYVQITTANPEEVVIRPIYTGRTEAEVTQVRADIKAGRVVGYPQNADYWIREDK